MRATHPWEAEEVAEGRIDQLGQHMDGDFLNRAYSFARRLDDLAEQAYDVLVDEVSVEALGSDRHDACLTEERAKALECGQLDDLHVT